MVQSSDIERYMGTVRGAIKRLHIHGPNVDDAIQVGRVAVWNALCRLDTSEASADTWVYSNVTWRLKDWLTRQNRSRAPSESGETEPTSPSSDELLEDVRLARSVDSIIADLPPDLKQLAHNLQRGRSKTHIARTHRVSMKAMNRRMKVLREKLRPALELL